MILCNHNKLFRILGGFLLCERHYTYLVVSVLVGHSQKFVSLYAFHICIILIFYLIFCRQDVVMPCPIQCSDVVSNNLIEDVSMLLITKTHPCMIKRFPGF